MESNDCIDTLYTKLKFGQTWRSVAVRLCYALLYVDISSFQNLVGTAHFGNAETPDFHSRIIWPVSLSWARE